MTEVEPIWKTPKAKKPVIDPGWADAREERLYIDRHACQFGHPDCRPGSEQVHHRRPSDRRTGDHDVSRLVTVCLIAHGLIHDQPNWSVRHGWLLRSGCDGPYIQGCMMTCDTDHRT